MIRVTTLQEAMQRIADGERVVMTVDGKDVALVAVDELELLEEWEERLDLEAYRKAKAEPGPNIPLEDFLREMEQERAARRKRAPKRAKALR